jgi:starch phosphorylase
MFMFGKTVEELTELRGRGYDPAAIYESNAELKRVLDMIRDGYFSPEQRNLFIPIFDSLVRQGDHYMVLADYDDYVACQESVDVAFKDQKEWTRKTIMNVANVGRFSVDRLVQQYASEVWDAKPISEGSSA